MGVDLRIPQCKGVGGGLTTFREISLQDERRYGDSLSMPLDSNDPGHHQIK